MTDSPQSSGAPRPATDGIAGALNDLTEETRRLVRTEIEHARRETWSKAQDTAPGIALAGAAGVLGVFAAASGYRAVMRLFERRLPPGVAAVVTMIAYGVGAGFAATQAARRLREAPTPFPTETVRGAGAVVGEVADRAREG